MTPAARHQAAIDCLERIGAGERAERVLTGWARGARYAGSGDRVAIRDIVYDVLRRREACAIAGGGEGARALVLGHLRLNGADEDAVFSGARFGPDALSTGERAGGDPEAARKAWNMPAWLAERLETSWGAQAPGIARALGRRAPVFLRVNAQRATRDEAMARLSEESILTRPARRSTMALEVVENARRIAQSQAYREGLVELQDASSQAVVDGLSLRAGMRVLDYCAGGGGKALAMAAAGAEVTAHDANPGRMADIPARAARAGVTIERVDQPKGPYDLVLCDAPCSGSGSWRRDPEGKWRLTPEALGKLGQVQDRILSEAARLVAPGGVLAYATCSVLAQENAGRVAAFRGRNPRWRLLRQTQWLPGDGGDGFYLAELCARNVQP